MLTCQLLERRKSSQYWKNKVVYILVYQIELCSVMICMCAYQFSFREILDPSNPHCSGRNPGNEFDSVERARVWRKFSDFRAIVTDQADHMLLNIQCSMSQPHPNPQPPSKCPQETYRMMDYKGGVGKTWNYVVSVTHPSVKIDLSSVAWSHLQRTIWTLNSGERK